MNSSSRVTFEVCIDSVANAIVAEQGGGDRLELCSALSEGGITPSAGLIEQVMKITSLPVMVMIRPRGGSFVYSDSEANVMLGDIALAKRFGVAGVVFGALTNDGKIDEPLNRRLLDAARPLSVTFHRAFDEVSDPLSALEQLNQLGFDRLLTSGQEETALAGANLISGLMKLTECMEIIAGAGVRPENAAAILEKTGVREIHGTASTSGVTCRATVKAIRNAIDK